MGFPETFKALADPVRRDILQLLKQGRLPAGEIAGHFEMSNATISYHLAQLKKAELVFESKEKNFVFYELNLSVLEELIMWISAFRNDEQAAAEMPMPSVHNAAKTEEDKEDERDEKSNHAAQPKKALA